MNGIHGRVWRAWLALLVYIALIWVFSGESFSAASTSGLLAPLLRWLYPDISQEAIVRVHFFARKAAHLTEYALLAALAFRALRLSLDVSTPRVIALALGLVILVAGGDELRQSYLAARTGSPVDVAINLAGGALGVGLIVVFYRWLGSGAAAEKDA